MEALYSGQPFDDNGQSESVKSILHRYLDIEDHFPQELTGIALPYFADWFIENVHLVEITAYSDEDAYVIFETMNDRGLSLTPTDMLKGYLLANITDAGRRADASQVWRGQGRLIAHGWWHQGCLFGGLRTLDRKTSALDKHCGRLLIHGAEHLFGSRDLLSPPRTPSYFDTNRVKDFVDLGERRWPPVGFSNETGKIIEDELVYCA